MDFEIGVSNGLYPGSDNTHRNRMTFEWITAFGFHDTIDCNWVRDTSQTHHLLSMSN